MFDWFSDNQTLTWWIVALSAAMFVATLIATPILIARMPQDYFVKPHFHGWPTRRPFFRMLWLVLKNGLGVILAIAGLAMLVLPGQGLLTLLIGVMLVDFPGKHRVELWVVSRGSIYRATTWIRANREKPPLRLPDHVLKKMNGSKE